jgi:DNA-binding CsgD family transcriptional regulator
MPRLSYLRGEALAALGRLTEAETVSCWLPGVQPPSARDDRCSGGSRPVLVRVYAEQGRRPDADRTFEAARTLVEEFAVEVPESALRERFLKGAADLLPRPRRLTTRETAKRAFGGLTARQRNVVVLVGRGKSNREIADALVFGERTVETHVSHILDKLGFTSRAQIAAWAAERRLAG